MLGFYNDFLDQYINWCDFELIQMETDNNYMAILAEQLEDIFWPDLQAKFKTEKKQWLVWDVTYKQQKLGLSAARRHPHGAN